MRQKQKAAVLSQRQTAPEIYDMWIETDLAGEAGPGQFICIYPKSESTLLPRPISICQVNEQKTAIRIVYRIAGKGTREFSSYKAGEEIFILGPLGNGFPLQKGEGKRVLLMGGGIGIPPILQLAQEIKGDKQIVLGYRDNHFRQKGLEADVIFACGPMPMLRAIKAYAQEKNIPAYISLEEHMACGVGACLGCVVKTKEIDHHSHVHNARICTDGPVFEAEEVEI